MLRRTLCTLVVCSLFCVALSTAASAITWNVPGDFPTIQAAIDSSSVLQGHTILVAPGSHAGAVVTKSVEIKGEDGAVINSGPLHSSGLVQGFRMVEGSSGATISHLTFQGVDLCVMTARDGAPVDDVTVEHCTMMSPIQGISDWRGCGWQITHNQIVDLRTRNGGGIGILVGDYSARTDGIHDNVVSHNKITGTLHLGSGEQGGYNGTGIVLYADFRYSYLGAVSIAGNRVVKNTVSLTSEAPGLVDVCAIELTDTRDDSSLQIISGNAIGFNDLRGTVLQLVLTPLELDGANDISRNLGENRGHGLPPSAFGPGGN